MWVCVLVCTGVRCVCVCASMYWSEVCVCVLVCTGVRYAGLRCTGVRCVCASVY